MGDEPVINNVKIHFKLRNWVRWPLNSGLVKKSKRANINSFCVVGRKLEESDFAAGHKKPKKDSGGVYQIKKLSGSLFFKSGNEELTVNITGIANFELILPSVHTVCSQLEIPTPKPEEIIIDTTTASIRLERRIAINSLITSLRNDKTLKNVIEIRPKTNYTFSGQTLKWNRISIIVFSSGAIVFLGAQSKEDLMNDSKHFLSFLQNYLKNKDP